MKSKKVPMRLCIGCGEMKPKKDLIRVLKDAQGKIFLDLRQESWTRCISMQEYRLFCHCQKGHRIERSFGCRVSESIYEEMEHALQTELAGSSDHLS